MRSRLIDLLRIDCVSGCAQPDWGGTAPSGGVFYLVSTTSRVVDALEP